MALVDSKIIALKIKFILIFGILIFLFASRSDAISPETNSKVLIDARTVPREQSDVVVESKMKKYQVALRDTKVTFEMLPIPGGVFLMGSPKTESDRKKDEGPQHKVKVEPFWMGKFEVTWDEFDVFLFCQDTKKKAEGEK